MHQVGQRRCADGCLPWSMAMLQCGSLACVREVAKILQFRLVEHPLVPRGTFRRFGLRAPIPAENLVSLSVRWGAGAPAKAIRRGGHPAGRRTHKTPKHASERSGLPPRVLGLRDAAVFRHAGDSSTVQNCRPVSRACAQVIHRISPNYRHLSTCCWIVRGREWAHIRDVFKPTEQCQMPTFTKSIQVTTKQPIVRTIDRMADARDCTRIAALTLRP